MAQRNRSVNLKPGRSRAAVTITHPNAAGIGIDIGIGIGIDIDIDIGSSLEAWRSSCCYLLYKSMV